MIEDLLESLESEDDVILMHPVTSQSLSATQGFLLKKKAARLPDDYIEFLHLSNGLIYRNIYFYGTSEVEEERMPDMITANEDFISEYDSKHLVLVGNDRHNLFVYNSETKMYEIVEKEDLEVVEEFEDLEDMMSEFFDNDSSFMREDDDEYMFEDDYED